MEKEEKEAQMDMLLSCCVEWWWVLRIRPIVHRGGAILCAVIGICILWSELVFNIKQPVISLVAIGLKACGLNYAAVEVICQKAYYHATTHMEAKQGALVYGVLYADVHVPLRIHFTLPS